METTPTPPVKVAIAGKPIAGGNNFEEVCKIADDAWKALQVTPGTPQIYPTAATAIAVDESKDPQVEALTGKIRGAEVVAIGAGGTAPIEETKIKPQQTCSQKRKHQKEVVETIKSGLRKHITALVQQPVQ